MSNKGDMPPRVRETADQTSGGALGILGNRVLRKEDPKFLTVGWTYAAGLDLTGAAHVNFVRSSMAHAKVRSVNTSTTASMPGVIAIHTHDDINLPSFP